VLLLPVLIHAMEETDLLISGKETVEEMQHGIARGQSGRTLNDLEWPVKNNILDLSNKQLVSIGDLPTMMKQSHIHCDAITTCDLSNNQLTLLSAQTLQGLYNLKDLNVSHNNIKEIHIGDFLETFPKLMQLNASYNDINKVTWSKDIDFVHRVARATGPNESLEILPLALPIIDLRNNPVVQNEQQCEELKNCYRDNLHFTSASFVPYCTRSEGCGSLIGTAIGGAIPLFALMCGPVATTVLLAKITPEVCCMMGWLAGNCHGRSQYRTYIKDHIEHVKPPILFHDEDTVDGDVFFGHTLGCGVAPYQCNCSCKL